MTLSYERLHDCRRTNVPRLYAAETDLDASNRTLEALTSRQRWDTSSELDADKLLAPAVYTFNLDTLEWGTWQTTET